MKGFFLHHVGAGFFIRMQEGQHTIDLLVPRICGECGSWVDHELTEEHRVKCTIGDELRQRIGELRRLKGKESAES